MLFRSGVSNMDISSKAPQVFILADSGFSYQAGGSQRPTLIVATDSARPNAYYEVSGFTIGDWCWFTRQGSPCRVIERQDVWGEVAYRVWLPAKDAVVRAREQGKSVRINNPSERLSELLSLLAIDAVLGGDT